MPAAAADTGGRANTCGCLPAGSGDPNPNRGRAVINEELSEGDEVVVEFIPSDLPASSGTAAVPAPSGGNTTVEGGNVANDTSIAVDASGGDAAADAEGGDFNVVEVITSGGGNVNADAGSGGTADAAATGGAVVIGNVNSGANAGNQIEVNQLSTGKILCFTPDGKAVVEVPTRLSAPAGNVQVSGGNVSNDTDIAVDASGGTASADASGGDDNVVVVEGSGNVNASAGSGGTANADASGGAVVIGDVNSGGNTGNDISVAEELSGQIRQRVNDRLSGRDGREGRGRGNQGQARQGECVPPPCVTPGGALDTVVSGGNVSNDTDIAVDASGGTASADASGGDDNIVQVQGGNVNVDANAGSGGTANANASGGAVEIGNVSSGGNTGNDIRLNNVTGQLLCLSGNDTLLLQLDLAPKGGAMGRPVQGGTQGGTTVSGGNVSNDTDIAVDASGGTASSDASGGSGNIVVVEGRGNRGNVDASAGSGGTANADASGGAVVIGDVNSGGNTGNEIDVNDDDEDDEDDDD